tara:strand:+ start:57 stop:911 length:855 start_codon:yes stop_codon:yes gene_type:complete
MDKSVVKKAKSGSLATNTSIIEAIEKQTPGFVDALPKGSIDPIVFVRICKTVIRENKALQQCDVQSLLGALMISAQLGLEPNSELHEAYLIPYGNKAQFQIGYQGLLKLANNSGKIKSIHYNKICDGEDYEYKEGKEFKFSHTPNLLSDRSKVIAYYAYAQLENEGFAVHVMTLQEIQEHGKRFSKAYNSKSSPWRTDFDAMAYKTVLIQLASKKLPKATQSEAMKNLSLAANKDSTTNYIPEDKIGKPIIMEEIVDDTDYEEMEEVEDKKEFVPQSQQPVLPE